MGDRIVVMKDGLIQQVAAPTELYDQPANKFVAGFIGTPPMNFFEGVIKTHGGNLNFHGGTFQIPIPQAWTEVLKDHVGKPVTFGSRPEDIGSNSAKSIADAPIIGATVEVTEPMGSETYVYLTTGDHRFISRVDAHVRAEYGEELKLPVDMKKAHFFDGETEAVIDLPR